MLAKFVLGYVLVDFIFGEEMWGSCPSCGVEGQHDTSSSAMYSHVTFCNYIFKDPGVNFTGCEYVVRSNM